MALFIRINTTTFVLVSLLTLLFLISPMVSSGRVDQGFIKVASSATNNPIQALQEKGKPARKLGMVEVEAVLDYDDAEPNPRHDPRRRRSNP
ncbi:uncharacterized protein LOC133780272 [Humulus lupulus]|uniref:uncharacterized protein LOC133780272 n=1 Tax=Humulus lupulus TaxID=3486 RepID=UPI002B40F1EF|nr:uncharacterized protein LOC133780272 [Humulus lupulus]